MGPWNDESNGSVNMLVDSGTSGHYFDDAIIPGLRDRLDSYQVLNVPRKITTTGEKELDAVPQELLIGIIVDGKGVRRSI